jgi:NF-kappa-B-activating protein
LGKRKEIDNVMKKARQQPANEYWDKKLLEAEEKDPNRWKHTGYKKMYVNGSPMQRKSRSPIRKTPVSPRSARHFPPQSPMRRRISRSRTPERYRERPKSPPLRYARKSPITRPEMKSKEMYRPKRPMSPPPKVYF